MNSRSVLGKAVTWLVAVTAIGVSIFLRNHQVDGIAAHAPMDVVGAANAELHGRNIVASIANVYLAPTVIDDSDSILASKYLVPKLFQAHDDAVFIVITTMARSVESNQRGDSDLTIASNTFRPQKEFRCPLDLVPGVLMPGCALFEIPATLSESTAQFRLSTSYRPRRDSRLVFTVDLSKALKVPSVTYRRGEIQA